MARSDYWIHGVSTFVEYPDRTTEIRHAGNGTIVKQRANSDNWFHLPIPTPTSIDGDAEVAVTWVALKASTNENARIRDVHLRTADEFYSWGGRPDLSGNISKVWKIGDEWGPIGISAQPPVIRQIRGSIALCLRVDFLDGTLEGEITFWGAGAAFDE